MLKFQTVERDSFFSRLDFRPKLFMVFVVTIIAFLWESPWLQLGMAVITVTACLAAGVRWGYLKIVLIVMVPFYVYLLLLHLFFNHTQVMHLQGFSSAAELSRIFTFPEKWWLIGGGYATWDGLAYGLNIVFKTLTLTMIIPLAVFTTDVDNMIVSMVQAHIPYKLAFIFSSTLRFFPLLVEEFRSMIEAQRLRGLAIEKMGPIKRVRVYSRVAVPLILTAMVKSQQLEVVLQSKAFLGSSDRTYLHESVMKVQDYLLIAFFTILLIGVLVLYFLLQIGTFGGPV